MQFYYLLIHHVGAVQLSSYQENLTCVSVILTQEEGTPFVPESQGDTEFSAIYADNSFIYAAGFET